MISMRLPLVLLLAMALVACASKPVKPYVRPAPEQALPAQADSAFAGIEANIRNAHGPAASGFKLLDHNADGLRWRLALIDTARHTIDLQYYLWYGDVSGRLLMQRVFEAADRGVKVRMLVDDLNTVISDAATVVVRDDVAGWLDAHPNLELRVFNPWRDRTLAGRVGESMAQLERVNHRMHNKSLIVDNQAAILGGRNLGDEYLGLNPAFNFHDLDVLGIGPVARQASEVFDLFWNSEWVMPAAALQAAPTQVDDDAARTRLARSVTGLPALGTFPAAPQDWSTELAALPGQLHVGTSSVSTDRPDAGAIRQEMIGKVAELMRSAQRELLIINAYIIPGERSIEMLRELQGRGAKVRVITNSLASHDVPAVNSHYKKWRKPMLEAGVDLHEVRHDAAMRTEVADTAPTRAQFMGLHSKGMVIDRERVWIGSMNFDPRSADINTEMGVVIESRSLAEEFAGLIERDAQPANSWQLNLDDKGRVTWTNDRETVTRQPARSFRQRVEDVIFMAFPKELY
jgi:cardiolipin synthase C